MFPLLSLLITFSVGTVVLGTDTIVMLSVFKFSSVSMNFYQLMTVGWFSFLKWFSLGLLGLFVLSLFNFDKQIHIISFIRAIYIPYTLRFSLFN